MSSVTVEIKGKETVSPASKAAAGSIKELKQKTDTASASFSTAAIAGAAVVAAIVMISKVVGECITEYAEQERALMTFNASMEASGRITSAQAASLREFADEMAILTGADDDAVLSMEAYLVAGGRTEAQIRKIIRAAADLSVVDGDLRGNVERLNASYAGVTRGLDRLVPQVKDLTDEQKAAGDVVDLVAKQYAGLADQLSGSVDVSIKNYREAWKDLKGEMGAGAATMFQPVVEWLTTIMRGWKEAAEEKRKYYEAKDKAAEGTVLSGGEAVAKSRGDYLSGTDTLTHLISSRGIVEATGGDAAALEKAIGEQRLINKDLYQIYQQALRDLSKPTNGNTGTREGVAGSLAPAIVAGNPWSVQDQRYRQGFGGLEVNPNTRYRQSKPELGYQGAYIEDPSAGRYRQSKPELGYQGAMISAGDGFGALSPLINAIAPAAQAFGGMFASLASVQAILNPLQTILQGMFEIIGPLINQALAPLVGILKIVGQVLGKLLAPVIVFLGDVIKGIAKALIWVINGIIKMINYIMPKKWKIDQVSLEDATEAGNASVGTGATGASASYAKQRDISVYIDVTTSALVGDGGIREFALIVKDQLVSAGVLGLA